MIVTVDGPAAAGKGTLARRIAAHYDLAFLDTGGLYRAAALHAIEAGDDPADPVRAAAAAQRVRAGDLDNPRLRDEEVGQAASIVAAIPAVRVALLQFQRDFASFPPAGKRGAVLDGRDIGTVVCPNADAKIYVTASIEARARRRFEELRARGTEVIYETVLQDLKQRDARDSGRPTAPLLPAADAFVLDTTSLDPDGALRAAVAFIESKLAGRR